MEKRFVAFLLLSFLIMTGYAALYRTLNPPPPPQVQAEKGEAEPGDEGKGAIEPEKPAGETEAGKPETPPASENPPQLAAEPGESPPATATATKPPPPLRRVTLGSVDPTAKNPYRMLVTLTNQGAAVERVELSSSRYLDLDERNGYLGRLALSMAEDGKGCVVGVVGPGTPAADAVASAPGVPTGLEPGDVLLHLDGKEISSPAEFERLLAQTNPGQKVNIEVRRPSLAQPAATASPPQTLNFTATLGKTPMSVIRPEALDPEHPGERDPLSFLFSLDEVGLRKVTPGEDELRGIPSLRSLHWEVIDDEPGGVPDEVAFRAVLDSAQLAKFDISGGLEITKRFHLARDPSPNEAASTGKPEPTYHLTLSIEISNLGSEPQEVAYRLDGPTGLPLEGWWYSHKVSPDWGSAGMRDVLWRSSRSKNNLIRCILIVSNREKHPENPHTALFNDPDNSQLRYAGVDAVYFSSALMPAPNEDPEAFRLAKAYALTIGPIQKQRKTNTDVTCRLISRLQTIAPGQTFSQKYRAFVGPKEPELLAKYGLEDTIEYGWFYFVAKPMLQILHAFYNVVGNYGLAIIMLTVLVRGCMYPLGRKQALNAQKMQELAPEMKKIAEMYKNDMDKRTKATQDLYKKHKFNPLGGCGLMFIQLPIFIGLYRSLNVDIELRGRPLIPGIEWCSNLAGPDMLLYWKSFLPLAISGETGWLGPYLNILPLVTVSLFIVHQKLFTPPAMDEQAKMQQQMMSFMTIFMGVMFFKVAAGLCIYFIASSLWGVAERLLLPKPQKSAAAASSAPVAAATSTNGAEIRAEARARKKQRKK